MFNPVAPTDLDINVFQEIGRNWTLVSARNPVGQVNTLTASWGGMGVLWGKDVVTIYIRQSRYTKEFIDSQDYFTVSLFDGHKPELGVLGKKSGRDGDKISEVGFDIVDVDGQPTFAQAKAAFVCRKLHQVDLTPDTLPADIVERFYGDGDFHTMYIGEITGCFVAE